jgi:uncharacterized membrane-anchored protein
MKRLAYLAAAAAALVLTPAATAGPAPAGAAPEGAAPAGAAPADAAALQREIRRISDRLHPVTGDVRIAAAGAVLHLGEDYYFLPADEARLVLTDAWGNPPDSTQDVLGMVFPAGRTFADDTWGAVITYQPTGYVRDDDAQSTDYNELLDQMRAGEAELNAERTRLGYPAQHIVGWAQAPTYDRRSHSLVWASNVNFQGQSENSLNYDVRLLGRRGVLSLNMVTGMSKLEETRTAAQRLAAAAEFVPGSRYADYREGTDAVAEYGVAGLIAAGVGVTVAKKAGILALILGFGKKGLVLIFGAIALAGAWFRRRFGGGEEEVAYDYQAEPDYGAADDMLAVRHEEAEAAPGGEAEGDGLAPQPTG